jgi:rubrerythrin
MDKVQKFLAHAIELERDAARRYEDLAAAMQTEGNAELRRFFQRMARFSRMHLAQAMKRGAFREVPQLAPHQFEWPDGLSPEVADWAGVDAQMDGTAALVVAIDSERRGHAYYSAIALTTQDPEVKLLAAEFAAEEAEHVAELEKLIAQRAA